MRRTILCLTLVIAACAPTSWQAAHEACQGNTACQDRVEAKQAALFPPAQSSPASHDPIVAPVVPLPRQPNTCAGRTEDRFPTTRCY